MARALQAATAQSDNKILLEASAPAMFGANSKDLYATMDWVRSLASMWRVAGDIKNYSFNSTTGRLENPWSGEVAYNAGVYTSFYKTVALSRYVAPGRWNDPDQLLIGDNGMTVDEEKSQFALWSILGAPLLLSTDVRRLTQDYQKNGKDGAGVTLSKLKDSLDILTNKKIIAVDQDPLGQGGYIAYQTDASVDKGTDVIVKPLSGDRLAVVILNKSSTPIQPIKIDLRQIGIFLTNGTCTVSSQNLWSAADAAPLPKNELWTGVIPAHGNAMYKLAAQCDGKVVPVLPTGQIYSVAANDKLGFCLTADTATPTNLNLKNCTGSSRQIWIRDITNHRIKLADQPTSCLTRSEPAGAGKKFVLATCDPKRDDMQSFIYFLNGSIANISPLASDVPTPTHPYGGLCLDIYGSQFNEGTSVDPFQCQGSAIHQTNQLWSAPGIPG